MTAAEDVRRQVIGLERTADGLRRAGERHGAAADELGGAVGLMGDAWTSPRATRLVAGARFVLGELSPVDGALRGAAADLEALAATASRVATQLAELDAAQDAAKRRLIMLDRLPPEDAASERTRTLAQLDEARSDHARQLTLWDQECRETLAQLRHHLELVRRAAERVPASTATRRLAEEGAEQLRPLLAVRARGFPFRSSDGLDQLRELVLTLPEGGVDLLFASFSDDELQDLVAMVHLDSRATTRNAGDARDLRHELWTLIAGSASIETFRRIASVTDDLNPSLADGIGDRASADKARRELFESLLYHEIEGELFWLGATDSHAVAPNDVSQGAIGNCYLIAAMMGIARLDPSALERMFTRNPNGTVTVTFADGTQVTVTPDVAWQPDGDRPEFAGRSILERERDTVEGFELWPLLLEKAVAQRVGGWDEIAGGWAGPTTVDLVGGELTTYERGELSVDAIADYLDQGTVVYFSTVPSRDDDKLNKFYDEVDDLVGRHAYVVEEILPDGRVQLINPWHIDRRRPRPLTEDELQQAWWRLEVVELP